MTADEESTMATVCLTEHKTKRNQESRDGLGQGPTDIFFKGISIDLRTNDGSAQKSNEKRANYLKGSSTLKKAAKKQLISETLTTKKEHVLDFY